ncbi:fibronectin type III domain-containing protein [Paenibacillus sp. FSL P2-0136]|uniref:RCC1 domain-containing protein n=1 Tax=Paenibacillus sp. FSL P2-0136 TaxID=2975317 RepID=UPI0030DC32D0
MYSLKRPFTFIISLILVFTLLIPGIGTGTLSAAAAEGVPVTVHQLKGSLNVNGIYYGTVELGLTIQNPGSGVSSTRYSLDDGGSWLTYSQPISFSDKKVYHILYQSIGLNNNNEAPKEVSFTIKKDNFPPETSVSVNGTLGQNSYYNSNVTVSLNATDAHSGIQYSEYSFNAGQTWNKYTTPFTVEGPSTIIYYRSTDVDGNVEKAKKTKISVDKEPPSSPDFNISPDVWSNSSFTVTITDGVDSQSGTLKSQYRVGNSGQWLDYSQPVEVSGNGLMNIYARTLDYAGNSSVIAEHTLQFDETAPTVPLIGLSTSDWTNEPVYINLDGGTDAESQVRGYDYKVGTATEWIEYVNSFPVRSEGLTKVYARTIDMAGNLSAIAEGTVKIDLTPPVAPANIFKINQFGTSALIRWSAGSDSLSGVNEYEILNGEELLGITKNQQIKLENLRPNEKYSITVVTIDNAGNVSEETIPLVFFTSSIAVSGYRDHNFALNNKGQVWGWGLNNKGQLGDGTLTTRNIATRISALDSFSMISSGLTQNIGLRADGSVWTWGQSSYGNNLSLQPVTGLDHIVSISSGLGHFVALKEDGTVWTWGNNGFGQLGIGTINSSATPVQVSGLYSVVSIAGGYYNTMALKEDGTVWIWGDGSRGILGYLPTAEYKQLTPLQVQGLENIIQIDFSYMHGAALKKDGTVWTWGFNAYGQLGNGSTYDAPVPAKVQNLSNIIKISSSYAHNLALTGEGKVWSWGDNAHGELGDGTVVQNRLVPVRAAHLDGIADIEAAEFYSFAVKMDGSLWAWGVNGDSQLGTGNMILQRTRTLVSGIDYPVDTVVPAALHLTTTGKTATTAVLSWNEASDNHGIKEYLVYRGTNLIQALPVDGNSIDSVTGYTATGLAPGTTYTFSVKARDYANNISAASNEVSVTMEASAPMAVSAGSDQTYALKSDGSVWAWGNNYQGQLGNGTATSSNKAIQTVNLTSITAVSAGGSYGLALKSDGSVWGWGDNSLGQLGYQPVAYQQYKPTKIENFNSVTGISAGQTHSLALKSDGTVWAWGSNYYGELGLGTTGNKYAPTKIPSLSGVKAISAGMFYSLALKNDGSVWAWGMNMNGQLGNGSTTDSMIPVKVNSLVNVSSLSAGFYHALALKTDGTVWAWGSNSYGQLGDRTYTDRSNPVNVTSISGITQISAGMYHSIAKKDSALYSWGYNASGQLGNNSTSPTSSPITVSALTNIKDIDAGVSHNAAIDGNVVKTWGGNSSGELGNGSSSNSRVPVTVLGLTPSQTTSLKTISSSTLVTKDLIVSGEAGQSLYKNIKFPEGFVMPDLIAPTAPTHVGITKNSSAATLQWEESKDNKGVKEYWVFINEKLVLKTTAHEGIELQLPENEVISITVIAVDEAGNVSNPSMPVSP